MDNLLPEQRRSKIGKQDQEVSVPDIDTTGPVRQDLRIDVALPVCNKSKVGNKEPKWATRHDVKLAPE
jgi:hypothetical protein